MYLLIAVAACVASFLIGMMYANQKNESAKNLEIEALKRETHQAWSAGYDAGRDRAERPSNVYDNFLKILGKDQM